MIYKMEIILRIITNFVTCKIIQVTCKALLPIKKEGKNIHNMEKSEQSYKQMSLKNSDFGRRENQS
jgi:hypothetical protein